MYISKRKKVRRNIKNAIDEYFDNGCFSADALAVVVENMFKYKKLINSYFAMKKAQDDFVESGKAIVF